MMQARTVCDAQHINHSIQTSRQRDRMEIALFEF